VPRVLPKLTSSKVVRPNPKTVLGLGERVAERHELTQRQGRDWSHKLSERDGHGSNKLAAIGCFDCDELAGYYAGISLNRRLSRLPTWCIIVASLLRHDNHSMAWEVRADSAFTPSIGPPTVSSLAA
jgi:hypothetical protein